MGRRRRSAIRWVIVGTVVAGAVAVLSFARVTTRQGVDFVVSMRDLPLYAKLIDFIDRDINYRSLVGRVLGEEARDEAKVIALLDWTRRNVRDVPPGFPVVDDHVWHIIVRGYGVDEQKADVFTTLTTYAGLRGYWIRVKVGGEQLPLSLVYVARRWRVFDVANGVVFRDGPGELATVEDLMARPDLPRRSGAPEQYHGVPYTAFVRSLQPIAPPRTVRGELQMPWSRLVFEARRVLGWEGQPSIPEAESAAPKNLSLVWPMLVRAA